MSTILDCPTTWNHDVYSCPRWLWVLCEGGRAPAFHARSLTAELPVHVRSPTANQRYAVDHLLDGVVSAPIAPWFAGPMSGYRTDPLRHGSKGPWLDEVTSALATKAIRAGKALVMPYLPMSAVPSPDVGGFLVFAESEYWLRPAATIEEYLIRLSAHRRTAVRHELRTFHDTGAKVAAVPLRDHVESFAALTAANSQRRGVPESQTNITAFLGRIAEALGDDALLLAAMRQGRLLGGVLGLRHRGVLSLRMTGFDDAALQDTFAYFVLTYYAATMLNDELGVADVHLGVGAAEAKIRRGARAEPLFTWVVLPEPPWLETRRRLDAHHRQSPYQRLPGKWSVPHDAEGAL